MELRGPVLAVLVEVAHPATGGLLLAVLVEPVGEAGQATLGVVVTEVLHDVDLGATLLRATLGLATLGLHPEGRVLATRRLGLDAGGGEAVGEALDPFGADVPVEPEVVLLALALQPALVALGVVEHAQPQHTVEHLSRRRVGARALPDAAVALGAGEPAAALRVHGALVEVVGEGRLRGVGGGDLGADRVVAVAHHHVHVAGRRSWSARPHRSRCSRSRPRSPTRRPDGRRGPRSCRPRRRRAAPRPPTRRRRPLRSPR